MIENLILGVIFGIIVNYYSVGFTGAVYCTCKKLNSYAFRMFLIAIFIGGLGIFVLKTFQGDESKMIGVMGIDAALMAGAFIFGIGMMLSDGCILGMIRDLGNGNLGHIITFVFVVVGTIIGNASYKMTWLKLKKNSLYVYLPDAFGRVLGIVIFVAIIALTYFCFYYWDKRNLDDEYKLPKKNIVGGIILGLFMILYQAICHLNLGVSGAFPYYGAWVAKIFDVHPEKWTFFQIESAQRIIEGGILRYDISLLLIGILLGSLITSSACFKFKLYMPESFKEVFFYAAGGFLMGYGTVVAGNCNLSGFLSSAANLSLSAWIYLPFMMLGGYAVIKRFKL